MNGRLEEITVYSSIFQGDLVQLKDILVQGGSFELRSKSLNVLVMVMLREYFVLMKA